MRRVQRSEPAERTREVAVVLRAPCELDGRAPRRIIRFAVAPGRREDGRQVVRVVVVTRALRACATDRIGESSGIAEVGQRRGAHSGRRRRVEIAQHAPQQHVTREVEGLLARVVRRRLVRGDEAEGGAPRQQRADDLVAPRRVPVGELRFSGEPGVVLQQQEWVELLIELKDRILRDAVRERRARPPTTGALRRVEQPADESVHHRADTLVMRRELEQHATDVVRVTRPDQRQDLVIRQDRDEVIAGSRSCAVERIGRGTADRAIRLGRPADTLPPRTTFAHLSADEIVSVAREDDRLADRILERVAESDRDDERQAHPGREVRVCWERDSGRRAEVAVIEPDELPVLACRGIRSRRRQRAAGGQLRVGGAAEPHPAVPLDPDANVVLVRGDADDLQRARAATRSQRDCLEAGVTGMVEDRERKRVLDQERLRLAGC